MAPNTYTYAYDPIGNREEAAKNGSTTYYCANELNQYTYTGTMQITCPPQTPTLIYDADGNLKQDDQFTYTWDGGNRLIGVAPASSPVNGDKKLAFKYDYMNRRVEKTVWTYDSGWGSPTQVLRFVYDAWNVVLVLDGRPNQNNAVLTKYTWGLDLSGQRGSGVAPGVSPVVSGIHGAGGIGGLLAVEETATQDTPKYWFLYNANGNIGQVVQNTTNYPVAAHYEYDAYGNVLGTPTGYAAANPFRFSTKWFDAEITFCYYGYRYYRSAQGRWLSRDPLAELPGLNLYAALTNEPLSKNDADGRIIVGLDGWNYLPGISGKHEIDSIGTTIKKRVNAWRQTRGLPDDAYIPIAGVGAFRVDDIASEASAYRLRRFTTDGQHKCHVEGFVLFGYSDGATSIYQFFETGKALAALTVSQATNTHQGTVAGISYVGLIDMVRATVPERPGELDKSVAPYSTQTLTMADQFIALDGDVYYQDYDLSGLVNWRGYREIGSFGITRLTPSNHFEIIKQRALHSEIIDRAYLAYVAHAEKQMRALGLAP